MLIPLDIPGRESFTKIEPVQKGWSEDTKYYVEDSSGRKLLLRLSGASGYESKKANYKMLERAATLGIPMSRPVDFGLCNGGKNSYQLLTWVEGKDVEASLPEMPEAGQYQYGLKAGRLLKKIHILPTPENTKDWNASLDGMLRGQLAEYTAREEVRCELGDAVIRYLKENRQTVPMAKPVFMHGDYNPGNLIIMPGNELGVIDFSCSYGDPYWEIFKVSWRPAQFPHFFSGQIRGYFNGEPPVAFWKTYLYYWAFGALIALCGPHWAGFHNLEEGVAVAQDIWAWSNHLKALRPAWYLEDTP